MVHLDRAFGQSITCRNPKLSLEGMSILRAIGQSSCEGWAEKAPYDMCDSKCWYDHPPCCLPCAGGSCGALVQGNP